MGRFSSLPLAFLALSAFVIHFVHPTPIYLIQHQRNFASALDSPPGTVKPQHGKPLERRNDDPYHDFEDWVYWKRLMEYQKTSPGIDDPDAADMSKITEARLHVPGNKYTYKDQNSGEEWTVTLQESLGGGSEGTVHTGMYESSSGHGDVAIKKGWTSEIIKGALIQEKIQKAAKEAGNVKGSQSVLEAKSYFKNTGKSFAVLQQANGDLIDLLHDAQLRGKWDVNECFQDMLEGLKATHDAGYAHQDLKIENFLYIVNSDGAVSCLVSDFGTATSQETLKYNAGTPGFMDQEIMRIPEDLKPLPHDPKSSDTFAMAMIYAVVAHAEMQTNKKINQLWMDLVDKGDAAPTEIKTLLEDHISCLDEPVGDMLSRALCSTKAGRVSLGEFKKQFEELNK